MKRPTTRLTPAPTTAQSVICVVIGCGSRLDAGNRKKAAINVGKNNNAGSAVFTANARHQRRSRCLAAGNASTRMEANSGKRRGRE